MVWCLYLFRKICKTLFFSENLAFSICSLFGRVYAISACHSWGKIKTQKNPAITDWIAGHNIVRIALYCKRINSHFPFSYIIRSVSEVLHIGMKWRCFILWSGSETMLHRQAFMKHFVSCTPLACQAHKSMKHILCLRALLVKHQNI